MSFTHFLNSAISDASTSSNKYKSLNDIDYNSIFDLLDIDYEYTILVDHLKGSPHAQWGISYLKENSLEALFCLADVAYPRLVKQFYKNLKNPYQHSKDIVMLETTVDGRAISISGSSINFALGMGFFAPPYAVGSKNHYPINQIIKVMCEGICGPYKSIRRVHLAKKMWIIDHIFHRTIFPRGYAQIRSGRALQALMAVYQKEWFSPGSSIMLDMWEITKEIYEYGSFTTTKLHFPIIITRILAANNFPFHPSEAAVGDFPLFQGKDWIGSYRQLVPRRAAEIKAANKNEKKASSTPDVQFNSIMQVMTSISQKQDHILRIQKEFAAAHCLLDRRVYNLEAMITSQIAQQDPITSTEIWDNVTLIEQEYVAPTLNLESTEIDQVMPTPIIIKDTSDDGENDEEGDVEF